MEEEAVSDGISQKRKIKENLGETGPKTKKARLYSIKEFRTQLGSNEKLNALKEFSSIVFNSAEHDYLYDYLKNGGNCLELLQALENDATIPPSLVFDLVTQLLLKISASYGQYYSSAHEACRYLINNYLPLVHKMLGLSSSKEERKACLKLLTAMATLSPSLAKDIMLNVKFHSANIELLTKSTGEKNSVRDCFVHFLTAFLIDGNSHTLSILLEKGGLLTGIIPGLQYDVADTVCVVVAAMKNHILENNAVMKTTKMHVFNTAVVRDIVNLYNWKGPEGLKALDKNNRTVIEIDKVSKSKVSECVHDFLLVLCTSHRHGVIFRDHLVGLGKKNQNGLMYTVLDSLDRPWEHSYASELVIKICRSCPDLTKNLWTILKPFLEPRLTEKWLNAISFAKKIISEMEPSCIEYCVKDLNPQQIAQIIEFLVSPSPILKILDSDNTTNDKTELKQHITTLLSNMLQKIESYLSTVKKWIAPEAYTKVKQYMSNYIARNYPNAEILLEDCKLLYLEENLEVDTNKHVYLETTLKILSLYKIIAPQLLHNLTSSSLDLKQLLLKLSTDSNEDDKGLETLQMKVISIFVDIDHQYFLPNSDIFSYIVPLLLRMFYKEKNREIQTVLYKLLKNTGIFDGCLYEINIWLNGIFNCSSLSESFAENFVQIIRNTTENVLEYQKELNSSAEESFIEKDIIDSLLNILENSEGTHITRRVKHRHLSPMILGYLKSHKNNEASKNTKKYLEFVLANLFHWQTVPRRFLSVLQSHSDHVNSNLLSYVQNWATGICEPLSKVNILKDVSEAFLGSHLNEDHFTSSMYPDLLADILQMCTFYLSNLASFNLLSENHSKNWLILIDIICKQPIIDETYLEILLENPNIINHFNIIHFDKSSSDGICSRLLFDVINKLGKIKNIESFIQIYLNSVYNSIIKILKKPKKYLNIIGNIRNLLNVFPLGYTECIHIFTKLSKLLKHNSDLSSNNLVLDIMTYCLDRVVFLFNQNSSLKPLNKDVVLTISSFLVSLNEENKNCDTLSASLKNYLEAFPHNILDMDQKLFTSILQLNEYSKDTADLATFLLKKNVSLAKEIESNLDKVADKKGVILPFVHVLVNSKAPENILKLIYDKLESSILKAIQKPQKVGQHFVKNYDVAVLLEKLMPLEKCRSFADKVHKFEVTEVFHVKLLEVCYIKIVVEEEISEKQVGNVVLSFVHLEMNIFKKKASTDEDMVKLNEVSTVFNRVLEKLAFKESNSTWNLPQIAKNETFKTFCKLALKYGVSGEHILLKIIINLIKLLGNNLAKEDASLLFEMLLSHSEFLNVALGEVGDTKKEVFSLFLEICRNWSVLMEKSHVAVILSAYRGMVTSCDRIALSLLKLYESKAEQTRFYDFKPFLWGRAAANHYSVRTQIESSLIRQPKIGDVLGIIKEDLVNSTITNYPLKQNLHQESDELEEDIHCYDLKFLLPLFSHLLAPEQQVKTYIFSRSGALSLTVIGLSSQDKDVRQAACHVLSRFHFQLEARQTGKDNLLWIRFIEALCKGAAVLSDFKLNNFASIFYARMALILTNPKHIMYTPLSSYLTAKQDLDLSTIPELYTLLFSSDVNYKEHRNFILEILRDGLRTEKDFVDFLKSMGLKLFSELFTSCVSDLDSRLLILEVLQAACRIELGVKVLCENYSLLSQLYTIISNVLSDYKSLMSILPKVVPIMLAIVKVKKDLYTNQLIFDILVEIVKHTSFTDFKELDIKRFFKLFYTIYLNNSQVFTKHVFVVDILIEKANDKFCNYVKYYGSKYVNKNSLGLENENKNYFLRLLVFNLNLV